APGQRLAWAARPGRPPTLTAPTADEHTARVQVSTGATRVLLGSAHDRFLRLARFLLTRENCEVEATKRLARTVDLVERLHPRVVVLDATGSLEDGPQPGAS